MCGVNVLHIQASHTDYLYGEISVQGSKNAVLPMIASALLNKGITVINNCPDIIDVRNMIKIISHLGCRCSLKNDILEINSLNVRILDIPKEDVSKLRSSVVLLGALLGRENYAKLSYPGGCNIGQLKIDVHLEILKELGYEVVEHEDEIICKGKIKKDANIHLKIRSVGATENGILASVISDGKIIKLSNVAKEPEIINLCDSLNRMGANISGAGTNEILIKGVKSLNDTEVFAEADRIVAGTYMAAVTAVSGKVKFANINKEYDKSILAELTKFGMEYTYHKDGMLLKTFLKIA